MANPIPSKYRLEDDFKNSVPLEGRDFVEEVFAGLVEMSELNLEFEVKWSEEANAFLLDRSKCTWETLDEIQIHLTSKNRTIKVRNEKYLNSWPMMDLLNEILKEQKSEKRFYLTSGLCDCIVLATKKELSAFMKRGWRLQKRSVS